MHQDIFESVSVVVPVWNGEKFLAAAIESIFSQRHGPIEVIVVDDGSNDRSASVAESFDGVRVLRAPHRGIAATRNEGVRHARGRLLAFLDADDLWADAKLRQQLAILRARPDIDMVSGATEQFYDESFQGERAASQESSDAPVAGSILIRRAAFNRVGPFDETLKIGEFIDWYSRARIAGVVMHRTADIVLKRRIHGANTTATRRGDVGDYVSVLRSHLQRRRAA